MKKIVGILGMAAVLATSAFALDFSTSLKVSGKLVNVAEDGKFSMFSTDGGVSTGDKVAFAASDDVAGASMEFKVVDTKQDVKKPLEEFYAGIFNDKTFEAGDITGGGKYVRPEGKKWADLTDAEKTVFKGLENVKTAAKNFEWYVKPAASSFVSEKVLSFTGLSGKIWVKPFANALDNALTLTVGNVGKMAVGNYELAGDTVGFLVNYAKSGIGIDFIMNAKDYWMNAPKNGKATIKLFGLKGSYTSADLGAIALGLTFDNANANTLKVGLGYDLPATLLPGLTLGVDLGMKFSEDAAKAYKFNQFATYLDLGYAAGAFSVTTNDSLVLNDKGVETIGTKLDVAYNLTSTLKLGAGAKATFAMDKAAMESKDWENKAYGTNAYLKLESSDADWFKPHLSVNFNDWFGNNPKTTDVIETAKIVINLGISGNIGICNWTLDMNHNINKLNIKNAKDIYSMDVPFTMSVAF